MHREPASIANRRMIIQLPIWLHPLRRHSITRRRRPRFAAATEALESRTMLAGNVAAVVDGGDLTLTGDEADNSVKVTVVDGDIVVQGIDGTTINGSSDPFVAFAGTTTIGGDFESSLGRGADTLRLTGPLTVTGRTRVTDTSGATQVGITDATIDGAVHIRTGQADDNVSITGSTFGSTLTIIAGGGQNLVSVFDTTVAGNVSVTAVDGSHRRHRLGERILKRLERLDDRLARRHGDRFGHFIARLEERISRLDARLGRGRQDGSNQIVIEDSTTGSVRFYTGRGADNVVVQDSTANGNVHGNTGSGDDFVMFDGAIVTGTTSVSLRLGNDKLVTQNTNTFEGNLSANGGPRRDDAMQTSDATVFNGKSKFHRFESSTVSDAMIQMGGTDTLAAAAALRMSLNENGNPPALTLDTSMNTDTVPSNDTLVTTQQMFTIAGQTDAGATVTVAGGPDGAVDLGTTTADTNGDFSIDVSPADGATTIMVTAMTDGGATTEQFNLHKAVGAVVRFASSQGMFDVEMLNGDAPNTVANFNSYLNDYVNSFVHRAGDGTGGVPSVVQGGGFALSGTDIVPIATNAPIANEFNVANSNLAGTLSTALSGDGFGGTDPDSATSQWFFNVVDNTFLDAAKHVVFGRVIGTGLNVLQAIQGLPTFDITASVSAPPVNGFDPTDALTDVPLDGYDEFSEALPGTVTVSAGNIIVTGTGTNFTATLEAGELIQIDGVIHTILEVTSDTSLTLTSAPATAVADATIFVNPVPTAGELALFSSITEILPAP